MTRSEECAKLFGKHARRRETLLRLKKHFRDASPAQQVLTNSTNLEDEGDDPGRHGGGGGGAGVLVRADLVGSEAGVLVHSDDALVLKNRE